MEVVLVAILAVTIIYAFIQSSTKSKLESELRTNDQLLRETLLAHERELSDHKESTQELAIVNAKLQTLKSSTLTPDNAVPKDMHVVKVLELTAKLNELQTQLDDMTCKFEESRGKQISERVRLGQVAEQFVALHENFPYDRKKVKALFQPIDLIYFGDDEIVFMDVKTGAAGLSPNERKIRDNIRGKRVRFEVHRLDHEGYRIEKDGE